MKLYTLLSVKAIRDFKLKKIPSPWPSIVMLAFLIIVGIVCCIFKK